MKIVTLFIIGLCILLFACKKQSSSTNVPAATVDSVVGHLRYYCACFDGPGVYYVVEQNAEGESISTNAADSILLLGDGKGGWVWNITGTLARYVDVHTRLTFTPTGQKGCTTSMALGCPLIYPVVDTISFTVLP